MYPHKFRAYDKVAGVLIEDVWVYENSIGFSTDTFERCYDVVDELSFDSDNYGHLDWLGDGVYILNSDCYELSLGLQHYDSNQRQFYVGDWFIWEPQAKCNMILHKTGQGHYPHKTIYKLRWKNYGVECVPASTTDDTNLLITQTIIDNVHGLKNMFYFLENDYMATIIGNDYNGYLPNKVVWEAPQKGD